MNVIGYVVYFINWRESEHVNTFRKHGIRITPGAWQFSVNAFNHEDVQNVLSRWDGAGIRYSVLAFDKLQMDSLLALSKNPS